MKKRLTPLSRRIYVMSFAMIFSVTLIVSTAFGYVILRLDQSKVNDACFGNFNDSSYGIMYTDAFGNIVLSSNPGIIGQKYDPAEKFQIEGMQISMSHSSEKPALWRCFGYSKIYAAFSGMLNVLGIILVVDIICISLILMILHMSLKRMSRPRTELISMIKNIRHGNNGDYTAADDELKDAQRNPQKHKNLMLRLCGLSVYFVSLTKEYQDEVISRNF